ncbi:hypothetical protein [Methylobacterium sp. Leaf89]|uniref:hypothetical protein n=1 Tax=Methylobacterium sp. Leaf89 TaxID=1736245 RepID=UPI0006F6E716|nr:hypothetical protein [Methylobacterium sp. Leaf89]KQO67695.1 hypothetical protein ASF18_04010 [Methylobacterium sp. Leaf89]
MTTRSKILPRRGISLGMAGLAGALVLSGLAGTAQGQDLAYGSYPYAGYENGYGGPLIHGDYVGAPLTRFPRPSELVPSAWGYGTYGIPTVAGIRSASVGTPTVYVIEGQPSASRAAAPGRSRVLTRGRQGRWSDAAGPTRARGRGGPFQAAAPVAETSGGARVIPVRVSPAQITQR